MLQCIQFSYSLHKAINQRILNSSQSSCYQFLSTIIVSCMIQQFHLILNSIKHCYDNFKPLKHEHPLLMTQTTSAHIIAHNSSQTSYSNIHKTKYTYFHASFRDANIDQAKDLKPFSNVNSRKAFPLKPSARKPLQARNQLVHMTFLIGPLTYIFMNNNYQYD